MNGCKEDCGATLASGSQEAHSPTESTIKEQRNGDSPSTSELQNDVEEENEEEEQLKMLSETICMVREGQSPLSPLLLYSLENIENNVVCTSVSHSGELLAAGFESSDVRVWGLTEGGIPAELREVFIGANIAHFKYKKQNARLACDINSFEGLGNMVEEEEDEWTDSPIILRGHCSSVQDVAISGNLLYSCSTDTTLRSWNLQDQMCAAIYRGHSYPIWCVDVSAWGVYIATGSQDRTARLWTPDRAFPLRTYAGHGLDVDCIRFHPNGLYLATGSCDHSVRLWSVSDGKLVRVFPHSSSNKSGNRGFPTTAAALSPSVTTLAFSPDGKYLASGAEDQKVRIWDLAAGSMVNELSLSNTSVLAESQHFSKDETPSNDVLSGPISGLCWSSGGERLACAFQSGSVAVWELRGGPNGEYFPTFTCASVPHSFEEGLWQHNERSLSRYSTEMQTISSINYIDRDVLVCVGISPSRSLSSS